MNNSAIQVYRENAEQAQKQTDQYSKLINTYSLLRLLIFALLAASVYMAVKTIGFGLLAVLFVLLLLAFVWLVSRQSYFEQQKQYFIALKAVNDNEIASITDRSNIYNNGIGFADDKHYYSADLDIFGKASLYQLINRAATFPGRRMLAGWLNAPSDKSTILSRQEAVREIAGKNQWRLDVQARLLFANNSGADHLAHLFTYLRKPLQLQGEKWIKAYIRVAPYLLLVALASAYFYSPVNSLAVLIALFNIGLIFSRQGYITKSSFLADKMGDILARYTDIFKRIEQENWQYRRCQYLVQQLKDNHTSRQIHELSVLINKLNYNLVMIVNFVLNVFLLWSLKQVIAIEDWKRNNKQNLEDAFEIIAEFETLSGLASLNVNYPNWCFPEIIDGDGYTYSATALAHPLIDIDRRVSNDFNLNEEFKIDIITGSNMAGKSTFLRTIGINTVLGLCGAPVCASIMQLSVIRIITYMRIKDSLNESTSTFKAELDRLQMLLAAVESDEKTYFLIDEMLRGTNSVDKYRGSKAVIEQLIRKKGVGQVATHDLQIARLEDDYPDYIRNFYFDIQVQNGEMLLDYKIKHGECKTFNASLLLQQIGIEVSGGDV